MPAVLRTSAVILGGILAEEYRCQLVVVRIPSPPIQLLFLSSLSSFPCSTSNHRHLSSHFKPLSRSTISPVPTAIVLLSLSFQSKYPSSVASKGYISRSWQIKYTTSREVSK
ncbi:hypothetical protein F4820DRAFT_406099 [Hypoxylon rubiginosum]|uniref:Uncharacterized protein n=1 Tax=Hypoxylon rubiginosum TaxID=110542 RepID=A0ACB9ZDY1_9PEZI|nr:hypothetical protein F4820DRAFT_406099 [Hypoxylon rubiginosum]